METELKKCEAAIEAKAAEEAKAIIDAEWAKADQEDEEAKEAALAMWNGLYSGPVGEAIIRMITAAIMYGYDFVGQRGRCGLVAAIKKLVQDASNGGMNPINSVDGFFKRAPRACVREWLENFGIRVDNVVERDIEFAFELLRRECVATILDETKPPRTVIRDLLLDVDQKYVGLKHAAGDADAAEKLREEYIRILDALCYLLVGYPIVEEDVRKYCDRISDLCYRRSDIAENFGKVFVDVVNRRQGLSGFTSNINKLRRDTPEEEYLELVPPADK